MRIRHIVCAALPLITLASNCVLAQPFFFRKDIPVGDHPLDVVVGDFNGDGRPDLAVNTWDGLYILLNQGGGNFGRPIRTGISVERLFVGDFNGDGKDDLVTNHGLLLVSRGDGTFLSPDPIADLVTKGTIRAAGDFNRDGKLDLLVGGDIPPFGAPSDEGVRVWLGNGDGTFRSGALLTSLAADVAKLNTPGVSDRVRQVVVADFNHDGRGDVAMLPLSSPLIPLLVLPGQGDGTFGPAIRTQIEALGLLVADFNGDGLPDLSTAGCSLCNQGMRGIALGKGDGSFQPPVPYPLSAKDLPWPLAAADFTGDGKTDLVVAPLGSANSISIYPGKGDGTFLPPIEQAVGWGPHAAAAADLDGDGRLDLVTANYWEANTVSILLAKAQGGPALRRAVSAATDTALVAPESLATLFAPTAATASTSATPPWPTRLGGISLEVRDSAGATRLAPLVFVSSTQINFQVPAGTALGEATLAIGDDRGTSQAGSMQVDALAPGLFLMSHTNAVPAATGVRVEPDGTQVPVPVFSCSGTSCKTELIPLSTAGGRPIYLSFYGTGFRGANADNVTCSIWGLQLPVLYAGPQGTPGLDQINLRLPPELLEEVEGQLYGPGPVSVTIRINGIVSNSARIDVN
jgi:uncharacterized protein (TIGR03437 family)